MVCIYSRSATRRKSSEDPRYLIKRECQWVHLLHCVDGFHSARRRTEVFNTIPELRWHRRLHLVCHSGHPTLARVLVLHVQTTICKEKDWEKNICQHQKECLYEQNHPVQEKRESRKNFVDIVAGVNPMTNGRTRHSIHDTNTVYISITWIMTCLWLKPERISDMKNRK